MALPLPSISTSSTLRIFASTPCSSPAFPQQQGHAVLPSGMTPRRPTPRSRTGTPTDQHAALPSSQASMPDRVRGLGCYHPTLLLLATLEWCGSDVVAAEWYRWLMWMWGGVQCKQRSVRYYTRSVPPCAPTHTQPPAGTARCHLQLATVLHGQRLRDDHERRPTHDDCKQGAPHPARRP